MQGDCIFGWILIGFILGMFLGIFLGIGCGDSDKTLDKLKETESNLNEVITERDTYKNLILQKSLEE